MSWHTEQRFLTVDLNLKRAVVVVCSVLKGEAAASDEARGKNYKRRSGKESMSTPVVAGRAWSWRKVVVLALVVPLIEWWCRSRECERHKMPGLQAEKRWWTMSNG